MKKYILALDEGTTSARAILFDKNANVICVAQHEIPQIYPKPGWVEQDAMDIYANQYSAMTECIAKSGISSDQIAAIGITNQRETTVVWEKSTGIPICNAIVWQCRRTADICSSLSAEGLDEHIIKTTGLKCDAYFSGTKLKWILDHYDPDRKRSSSGELLFGTIDTWLLWKLTNGKTHATDITNASRTMFCNIHTGKWDELMLEKLNIPKAMLPEIRSCSEEYGTVNVMGNEIPICGMAGDQQAALFGQLCFNAGDAKNTYGTGCFLLEHTGKKAVRSKNGLITTAAAVLKGEPFEYALEGSVFIGGAVIQWLRDRISFIRDAKDSEYFAGKVADSGGVYFVPAFTGLGAPYWDPDARGTITGMTGATTIEHIIRAALESIAYQTNDLIAAMSADSGNQIKELKVDGGASANKLLMQFQSDISDIIVMRPGNKEATAAGAAFLAGLGSGFYKNRRELEMLCRTTDKFIPSLDNEQREKMLYGWKKAVNAARNIGGQTSWK